MEREKESWNSNKENKCLVNVRKGCVWGFKKKRKIGLKDLKNLKNFK